MMIPKPPTDCPSPLRSFATATSAAADNARLDRAVTTVVGALQAGAAAEGISERYCFELAKLLNDAREDS